MRKKTKIVFSVLFAFVLVSILIMSLNHKIFINDKYKNIAIYVESAYGTNDFVLSTNLDMNKIPKSGYKLDTTRSTCVNNSVLSWSNAKRNVSISTNKSDKCSVYLTKLPDSDDVLGFLNLTANLDDIPNTSMSSSSDVEGIFPIEDDYGVSYVFRGNLVNNYVKFGQYASNYVEYNYMDGNGNEYYYPNLALCESYAGVGNCQTNNSKAGADMYWRIIRVNGDGSLRLVYDGTSAHDNNDASVDRVALPGVLWNTRDDDNKYVGYMYGGALGTASTSLAGAVANETDTNIKTILDAWYSVNILGTSYAEFISDEIFCNDRTFIGDQSGNSDILGYGGTSTLYRSADLSNSEFDLKCPQKNDAFTVEDIANGNGNLNNPIGLLTVEDAIYAGASTNGDTNSNYFLYKGFKYYTMSPGISGSQAKIMTVLGDGSITYEPAVIPISLVPVINISSEYVEALEGNGSKSNPYHF